MSEVFSNIGGMLNKVGGWFGSNPKVLPAGLTGFGALQNWMASRQASRRSQFVEDMVKNPTKFNAFVNSMEKPLDQGLVSSLGNTVQGAMAERGLSGSPAMWGDVMAQATAPYKQQSQEMAIQKALSLMGDYASSPMSKPVDLTFLLKTLMAPKPVAPPPQPSTTTGDADPFGLSTFDNPWATQEQPA